MAESNEGRRDFLKWVVGAAGAAVAALALVPGLSSVLDPLLRPKRRGGDFLAVGGEAAVAGDHPVALPVIGERVDAWTRAPRTQLGTVWLQKNEDGSLLALTAECPHLGCRIGYDSGSEKFVCPCHDSAFGRDGSVESGPSPRAMDRLEARVREGIVEVRFKRFRTQSEEQVEIG
jgi:menaquinol-cytochrome c reductase iron-sulfur subunit